jgi:acetylglutamate kinase
MMRVIKIGGRPQDDSALPTALARAALSDGRLCVVHGGGDEVTALQRQLGREPSFHNGRRITTAEDLDLVRMVLSGSANKRLVSRLVSAGLRAVGISGEDAGLLRCSLMNGGVLGRVGTPISVDPAVIETLLLAEMVPVISPLGCLVPSGEGCNVNGDDAAAAIAGALQADELLFVTDVPGVQRADGTCLELVDSDVVPGLIDAETVRGGMIAKLEAGLRALDAGVKRVRVGNLDAICDARAGTTLARVSARANA